MKTLLLSSFLAVAATLAKAINVRVGHSPWAPGPINDYAYAQVVMYVYGDDWKVKAGGRVSGSIFRFKTNKVSEHWRFCIKNAPNEELQGGCPVQASFADYELRVVKDDGGEYGNLLLESWHTHNGQHLERSGWCGRLSQEVYEAGNRMLWQCSFPGY